MVRILTLVLFGVLFVLCISVENSIAILRYYLSTITTIHVGYGGRVSWNKSSDPTYGDKIAYDRLDESGTTYQVWMSDSDGSNNARIVGSGVTSLPSGGNTHYGNPEWHPDGTYMLIVALQEGIDTDVVTDEITPGTGLYCDLYILKADGSQSWKIYDSTDYSEADYLAGKRYGVLHPHFNLAGNKIVFGDAYSDTAVQDKFKVAIGDFAWVEGTPVLSNIERYEINAATPACYEPHDFIDADSFYVTSDYPTIGVDANEIYKFDTGTSTWTRMTNDDHWDEHARACPLDTTSYMYTHFIFPTTPHLSEYWLHDATGDTQITWLNYTETDYWWVTSDFSWDSTGLRAACYILAVRKSDALEIPSIRMLTFTRRWDERGMGFSLSGGSIR